MSHRTPSAEQATWSIAAVARATGLTQHTLRAWERRFGFPTPVRLPSGHRRFTTEQVERLRLVKSALAQGHRASAVVPLPLEKLLALLPPGVTNGRTPEHWCASVIHHLEAFDLAAVARALHLAAAAHGVSVFLRQYVHPLLVEVGERWARGQLDIRHEHLLSEAVEDELRALRQALEPGAAGRPLVLAALPGETHGLPLHMVALAAVARSRRVHLLGLDTPLDEIVHTAGATDAEAVGVTVSTASASARTVALLNQLHAALPPRTALWVGGSGAGLLEGLHPGVQLIAELDTLEERLTRLSLASGDGQQGRPKRKTRGAGRRP